MSAKKAAPLTSALLARKGSAIPATVVRVPADAPPAAPETAEDAGGTRPDHANGKTAIGRPTDRDDPLNENAAPKDAPKVAVPKNSRRDGSTGGEDVPAPPASEESPEQTRAETPPAPEVVAAARPAAPVVTTGSGISRPAKIAGTVAMAGLFGSLAALSIAAAVGILPLEPPAPPRKTVERTISADAAAATAASPVPSAAAEVSVLPLAAPPADTAAPAAKSTTPAAEPKADITPESTTAPPPSSAAGPAPSAAPRPVRRPVKLAPTPAPAGRFTVQLSSVGSASAARREIRRLKRLYPELLGNLPLEIYSARGRHRIVTERYATRAEAAAFCGALNRAGRNCLVLRH